MPGKNAKPFKPSLEGGGGKGRGDTCVIGKGAVRSDRVSFHTLTIVKLLGVFGSLFHLLMFLQNR